MQEVNEILKLHFSPQPCFWQRDYSRVWPLFLGNKTEQTWTFLMCFTAVVTGSLYSMLFVFLVVSLKKIFSYNFIRDAPFSFPASGHHVLKSIWIQPHCANKQKEEVKGLTRGLNIAWDPDFSTYLLGILLSKVFSDSLTWAVKWHRGLINRFW